MRRDEMYGRVIILSVIAVFVFASSAGASEKAQTKTQDKTGEPYRNQERYTHPPATFCWPQPTILNALENDRLLDVYFRGEGFSIDDVDLETVRVFNIPPYTGPVQRVGRWLKTDCFIMRFLGASGFRPIPPEGIQSTYTVQFDLYTGEHIEMTGRYELVVLEGDLNFDGSVNVDDVIFLTDFLFHNGPIASIWDYDMEELMDLNRDTKIDAVDVEILIGIVGL